MDDNRTTLATYKAGETNVTELNAAIKAAWKEALADPRDRSQIAELLNVKPETLDAAVVPYEAEPGSGGLSGVEVTLLLFASTVAYDVAKGLAKSAADAALKMLWEKVLKKRIEPYLPAGTFDEKKEIDT